MNSYRQISRHLDLLETRTWAAPCSFTIQKAPEWKAHAQCEMRLNKFYEPLPMVGRELARPKLNSRISSRLNIEPLPRCPNIHMEVIGTVILLQVRKKYSIPRGLGTKVQQKRKKKKKIQPLQYSISLQKCQCLCTSGPQLNRNP